MNALMPKKPDECELVDFEQQCDAWFAGNVVADPGFMLPLTFMEVSTDAQFDFLRNWQRKVYEAGYIGMSWPADYGGGGMHPDFQRAATRIMRKYDAPIMLNAIGTGELAAFALPWTFWAGLALFTFATLVAALGRGRRVVTAALVILLLYQAYNVVRAGMSLVEAGGWSMLQSQEQPAGSSSP